MLSRRLSKVAKVATGFTVYREGYRGRLAVLLLLLFISLSIPAYSQHDTTIDRVEIYTLEDCIAYALQNQPDRNQAQINVKVTKLSNMINLSGWLPQVSLIGNGTHYIQLQTSYFTSTTGGVPTTVHTGVTNYLAPQLAVSQAVFSPALVLAAKSAKLLTKRSKQELDSTDINVYVSVSKAFYNLLLTLSQIDVLKEDTARLQRNVQDTYHQFVGGIVDETDHDQAVITLNNSKAQLFQQLENVRPAYATLKQAMGYPPEKEFNISFDTLQMQQEIKFDTTATLQYEKRIEYQELQTLKKLQKEVINYYRLQFLPTISVSYNYFNVYQSQKFSDLFNQSYPYSYFGLSFNMPLFVGFARIESVRRAKLQNDILDWSVVSLRSQIYTEYTTALASYKGNLYNWVVLKENVARAKNVYRIVSLQYKQGIVPYLNMIVAESNLITAEVGYSNALYQLLSSKIDLEKSMGNILYESRTD